MSKNSIIGRMFANAQETNDLTLKNTEQTRSASPMIGNTRRNLFGIRLNHDQLKQDLKDMWKDQIDRQTQNWGFDFENLKPLDKVENNDYKPIAKRFEWTKVKTQHNKFYNETAIKTNENTHSLTTFETKDLQSDYETEEEEEDDALAIPTFYKYQRRQKMNEEQNRLKYIQITKQTTQQQPQTRNAFSKMSKKGSSSVTAKKTVTTRPKVNRSTPRRSSTLQMLQTKNLIITFSENRKDTLRSAATTPKSDAKKSLSSLFEKTTTTLNTKIEVNEQSVIEQPLKQQSLLDMLKQRKRKTTVNTSKLDSTNDKPTASSFGASHNLRPRTTSTN